MKYTYYKDKEGDYYRVHKGNGMAQMFWRLCKCWSPCGFAFCVYGLKKYHKAKRLTKIPKMLRKK